MFTLVRAAGSNLNPKSSKKHLSPKRVTGNGTAFHRIHWQLEDHSATYSDDLNGRRAVFELLMDVDQTSGLISGILIGAGCPDGRRQGLTSEGADRSGVPGNPMDSSREVLIAVLMTWLSANFDLPAVHDQPGLDFVSQQKMAALRNGGSGLDAASQIVALYDARAGLILLPDRWTGDTPAEVSVLVHELVHHVQSVAKLDYPCPEAREALAYAAQDKWLSLFGTSLSREFELDPLTLKVRTACM